MFEYLTLKILSKKYQKPILSFNQIGEIITKNKYIFFSNNYIFAIPYNSTYQHPAGELCFSKNHLKECTTDLNFHSKNAKNDWFKFCVGLATKKDLEKYIII